MLAHGDVLVSKLHEDKQPDVTGQYSIIASKKTMQHLHGQDQDPWVSYGDPWQQQLKPVPTSSGPSGISASDKKVQQAVAAIQPESDVAMESQLEARVVQLEHQLQQVQHSQSDVERKVAQIEHHVQQVQHSQVGVEAKVTQLHTQLDQQNIQIGRTLDAKLSEQMDKIEALLSKRGRHE